MEQYIKKSALVAEIEKRIKGYSTPIDRLGSNNIRLHECKDILSFLDTLEVKDVDLEKELDSYFAKFNGLEKNNWNWRIDSINIHAQGIYDFAEHFFELGLQAQKGE